MTNETDTEDTKLDYAYKIGNKVYQCRQFFLKASRGLIAEFDKFLVYCRLERPGAAGDYIKRRLSNGIY